MIKLFEAHDLESYFAWFEICPVEPLYKNSTNQSSISKSTKSPGPASSRKLASEYGELFAYTGGEFL